MTDRNILITAGLFSLTALSYFVLMTAPFITPVLVASIAELIKTIV